jgi:hypothetical protein
MPSNLHIISDLRIAMETNQDLELMVTYKGIPVISKAKIVEIDGDMITLITHDPGLICIAKKDRLSILGSESLDPSSAQVGGVALQKREVRLQNFSDLGNRLGERMTVRVETETPIAICLESQDLRVEGEMVDISLQGAGLRISSGQYSPALKPGAQILASFDLPSGSIRIKCTVVSGAKREDHYRLSILFIENGEKMRRIFHYLVDRRKEIEEELLSEYQTAMEKINRGDE